eukprot:3663421-Pleurochrysis_carterae.AAC.1
MVSAVVLRARAPGPSACPLSVSAARHLPPSASVGARTAGGVRGRLRAVVASSTCAHLCRWSPPHASLPHRGGGEGMPAVLAGSPTSSPLAPSAASVPVYFPLE